MGDYGIREIADKLQSEGGVSQATLEELFAYYRDPTYWTTTISFTAPKADMCGARPNVGFGPKADIVFRSASPRRPTLLVSPGASLTAAASA